MHVRAEVRAMVDPAQNPFRVRHHLHQSEPHTISRGPVNRVTIVAPGLDPHALLPGHGMANTGLRPGRRDYDRLA